MSQRISSSVWRPPARLSAIRSTARINQSNIQNRKLQAPQVSEGPGDVLGQVRRWEAGQPVLGAPELRGQAVHVAPGDGRVERRAALREQAAHDPAEHVAA